MKIAILSDFHFGYERFREDAYVQAKEAFERAYSMSDMMIMPGDIFDFRHPKPDVIAEAITLFGELSKKEFTAKVTSFDGQRKQYTDKRRDVVEGSRAARKGEACKHRIDSGQGTPSDRTSLDTCACRRLRRAGYCRARIRIGIHRQLDTCVVVLSQKDAKGQGVRSGLTLCAAIL